MANEARIINEAGDIVFDGYVPIFDLERLFMISQQMIDVSFFDTTLLSAAEQYQVKTVYANSATSTDLEFRAEARDVDGAAPDLFALLERVRVDSGTTADVSFANEGGDDFAQNL